MTIREDDFVKIRDGTLTRTGKDVGDKVGRVVDLDGSEWYKIKIGKENYLIHKSKIEYVIPELEVKISDYTNNDK